MKEAIKREIKVFEEVLRAVCNARDIHLSYMLDNRIDPSSMRITMRSNNTREEYYVDFDDYLTMNIPIEEKLACIFEDFTLKSGVKTFNCIKLDKRPNAVPGIKKVIFNGPATIVIWGDDTKTVVKCCADDEFDAEKGLAMAISKKALGDLKEVKKWTKKYEEEQATVSRVIDYIRSIMRGLMDK